jgi:hypothetical protein
MNKKYDIAAYVWPAYTGSDPRTRMFWPEGIGEWETVKKATKKYDGHNWPRKPLWGYLNEADPYVMEMQINAAAEHGVNVFIYDWYWYDKRPFLENCLNDGYLKAKNNDKVKFYIMWANHNVNNVWDIRLSNDLENIIWDAAVDRKEFEIIANRIIEKYFTHPSYYKIDNKPVFMFYDTTELLKGLGGVGNLKSALDWFREQTVKAGFDGLHLQMCQWNETKFNLSGVDAGATASSNELFKMINADSMTHYQYCHFVDISRDYNDIMVDVTNEWKRLDENYDLPYYPHISLGWDNNPRFTTFRGGIVKNNTPENIEKALLLAKEYIDNHPNQAPLITINSWNEWTESSYLQPDDLYGYGYLEAVKKVFK